MHEQSTSAVFGPWLVANGPGNRRSIPGRFMPKTLKMVLDTSLFNTQQYMVRIKGKVEQPGKGVAPSPTPWWSSDWKREPLGCLWLRSLTTIYIYIYVCVCMCVLKKDGCDWSMILVKSKKAKKKHFLKKYTRRSSS